MMTEILRGKTVEQARRVFDGFHQMCTSDDFDLFDAEAGEQEDLERLQVLAGVREFPIRVKCATLAWHTMNAAVQGGGEISTE
jgi:nitrogen fixation NifU-like protein